MARRDQAAKPREPVGEPVEEPVGEPGVEAVCVTPR